MKQILWVFILMASILWMSFARADGSPGTLRIVIFSEDKPKAGVEVFVTARQPLPPKSGDESARFETLVSKATDEFGSATFGLQQGAYWVKFTGKNLKTAPVKVIVASEESTQMVLNLLGRDLPAEFELDQPEIRLAEDEIKATEDQVKIKGIVVDAGNGKPLAGARVFVPGATEVFVVNENGQFQAVVNKKAPRISVIHKKYSTRTLELDLKKKTFKVELSKAGLQLQDLVILAPSIDGSVAAFMEIRRKSSNVAEFLAAEQISRSGDGDAAASLRRVTGLTLVKGKYVYIRGLGERYSATLLNDGNLPSPDPARRIVPLDMFPAGILEGMVIQKSYSPELPGDFGGGSILLKTKGVPEKFGGKVSTSVGLNNASNRLLSYEGGKTDFLGIDDGTRELPRIAKEALQSGQQITDLPDDERVRIGRSFKNIYAVDQQNARRAGLGEIPPSLSFSVGDLAKRGKAAAGYRMSLLYDPSIQNREDLRQRITADGGNLTVEESFNIRRTQSEINTGATFDTGIQYGDKAELSYTGMILRKSQDTIEISNGEIDDGGRADERRTTLEWVERQLVSQQVKGRLDFNDGIGNDQIKHSLKVRYGWSDAYRYEPDRREYIYRDRRDGQGFLFHDDTEGVSRSWGELNDQANDAGLDYVLPIKVLGNKNATQLKVGLARQTKRRVSSVNRFNMVLRSPNDIVDQRDKDIETLQDQIGPRAFLPADNSLDSDDYVGEQRIDAAYGMIDTPIGDKIRVSMGGRYETSNQDVSTFNLSNAGAAPSTAAHETRNFFPVYTGTYFLTDKAQVRLAYSETINRPALRELSPAPFIDPDLGRLIRGNNQLVSSVITHYDARWEYYMNREESVSVGLFAKEFDEPIESIIDPGGLRTRSFRNAKAATSYGVETEFSKSLRFVGLKQWTLSANYSWIQSEVELPDDVSPAFMVSGRPLQGLSPWIVNVQLFWEGKKSSAGLLYNSFGERIVEVGTNGLPDIVEQPIHQLDFVSSWGLGKNTNISMRVRNLLDESVQLTQRGFDAQTYRIGQSYSLGLSQTF